MSALPMAAHGVKGGLDGANDFGDGSAVRKKNMNHPARAECEALCAGVLREGESRVGHELGSGFHDQIRASVEDVGR